ncbi:hypothetical protein B0H16DRAFT_1517904 [Mycena metata]|uniref:Uncharacterized protein n=1 Tax=Mycena metata TaxID=1033252 RepID=A0AAD7NNU9_9AGAR|nr:hypothetical protein B0H16DRAFT_1517904 [Mycena metata]
MHGAAFYFISRVVWWKFDRKRKNGFADRALVSRVLKRDDECLLAVRSLKLSTRGGEDYKDAETEIVPVLLEALARFPKLREFDWDGTLGPMPRSVLQTLLSANRQLETLRIGVVCAISPLDISGFPNLVNLEVNLEVNCGAASLGVGTAKILCPHSLRSLELDFHSRFRSDDMISATFNKFQVLVDNTLSLGVLYLRGWCIRWDLGRHISSYTFLHTMSLSEITPPPDTGLDFTHLPTLANLTLDTIGDINCGSLHICIRTPDTLRNLELTNVWPAVLGTNILRGVHLASLDSLALWGVPLTREDMDSIFAPQDSDGAVPLTHRPCMLKTLKIHRLPSLSRSAATIRSSRSFPALLHLGLDIDDDDDDEDLLDSLLLFLGRATALQKLELRCGETPPPWKTAFKAATNLRYISLHIHRLTPDHFIFHELGDALQHVSSLTLAVDGRWVPELHLTDDILRGFSKFTQLQTLVVEYYSWSGTVHDDPNVEQLSIYVPTLRTFTFGRRTWEIQRHAITGAFQRADMEVAE